MKKLSAGGSSPDCLGEDQLVVVTCEELGRPLTMVDVDMSLPTLSVSVQEVLLPVIGGSGEVLTRELPADADFDRRPSSREELLTDGLGGVGAASMASSSLSMSQ